MNIIIVGKISSVLIKIYLQWFINNLNLSSSPISPNINNNPTVKLGLNSSVYLTISNKAGVT